MRVLFVCLGNICRSPTAENAFRSAVRELDLDVAIDSAGTGSWHLGAPPDERMRDAASEVGLDLVGEARQVTPSDFDDYDLILAMDRENLRDLRRMAPPGAHDRIQLFRRFDPEAGPDDDLDVPDPYYGGPEGFRDVVAMVRRTAQELARAIRDGEVTAA